MPRALIGLASLLGIVLVAPCGAGSARAQQPSPPAPAAAAMTPEAASAYEEALALERARRWPDAVEAYEAAAKRWPERTEFRHRLRLCEAHVRLARRYQDHSFRDQLLTLRPEQAQALLDEVLGRIESHYVDAVPYAPLLRLGLDNMEVALRDPLFLEANAPGADPARVRWLRQSLQARRGTLATRDRAEANRFVAEACALSRQALGLSPTAVILEFVYGAGDALDDYSGCLSPEKLDDLYAVIDGNFVGLGVELKGDPRGLLIVGVIPGGPAAEAGLTVGDLLTNVEGVALAGRGLDDAASTLQGPEGSGVSIVVMGRDGRDRSLRLVRRPVEVHSVAKAHIVDKLSGVGYVQLSGFQKTSTEELRRAVADLQAQGLRYLVLDLRGNPGGLLDVSVELADEFLDRGVIVSTRGRAGGQSAVYRARPGASWTMPMAVLVDHDSASASEILAGALKDNGRAVVIGETSYGKGSVQSIFPLRSAPAGLKLTTAKFYSPRDRAYSERGVQPDVPVRVRTAARPAGDEAALGTVQWGDPATDPVLDRALAQARSTLSAAR